jgi:hypothetical protein
MAAIAAIMTAERATHNNEAAVRAARLQALRVVQGALSIADVAESVVIVSKVLHFWDADLAPMIDANVGVGSERLAASPHWREALRASGNPRIKKLSDPPRVEQYVSYWEFAYRCRACARRELPRIRRVAVLLRSRPKRHIVKATGGHFRESARRRR